MLAPLSSPCCIGASVFVRNVQRCPSYGGTNRETLTANPGAAYNVPYSGAGSYIHVKREILVRTRRHARTPAISGVGIPGQCAAAVTIRTHCLSRHLADPHIAEQVDRTLHRIFPLLAVPVHAYCLMPDHLHLLIGGVSRADLPRLIGNFITLSGSLVRRRFNIHLWNWRYQATMFEDAELIAGMARHILANAERGDWPAARRGSIPPAEIAREASA